MDHVKNLTRLVIIFFWVAYVAVLWTVLKNSANIPTLGIGSLLFYTFIFFVVTYVAVVLTSKLWSTK